MAHARLDDIVAMAFFARIVESGSFSNAAKSLGVSRAAVSHRIAALERRCGERLFHRTTRTLRLTTEGERLYESCCELTRAADAATPYFDGLATSPSGEVHVTAPPGFGTTVMVASLPSFFESYPDVSIRLSLTEQAHESLKEGFDVAIRYAVTPLNTSQRKRRLGADEIITCASPLYLERAGKPEKLEDLQRHACLQLDPHQSFSFGKEDRAITFATTGPLRSDSVLAVREAACLGLGLAVLPRSLVTEELRKGKLVPVLEHLTQTELPMFAIFPAGQATPPKVQAFVEHLAGFLGEAALAREQELKRDPG